MAFKGAKSTMNPAAAAAAKRHFKKVATQKSQITSGEGAMTGGFATSPGAPVVTNKGGKFLAKGKN